jgi:hypothetical protein
LRDGEDTEITGREPKKKRYDILVTQTDLAVFAECNAKWFLSNVLGIAAPESKRTLMNERNLGLLYHGEAQGTLRVDQGNGTGVRRREGRRISRKAEEIASRPRRNHSESRVARRDDRRLVIGKIVDGVAAMIVADRPLPTDSSRVSRGRHRILERGVRYFGRIDGISRESVRTSLLVIIVY